ncbi:uncharacterized protein F5147DRAFT_788005 [Suillus discolor]|uniref:Mediator of RNA polymerase II transcription subunit 12 n=1 Tax=Suillus discolor TaxID=1912936 RepID=A0A9P7FC85_9AGAM|nr:uncharacterized protein F5147DRAFT_788005 [Suillus discolor]KAG2113880.1 hypothetical protein F5147DRAFT_788005 [Suillus discolor]
MKQEKRGQEPPSPIYESLPPPWLPKSHRTADVGYPGFHPPRPGQDEDVLSDKHIKDGFLLPLPVPDEHQSASVIFLQQDAKGGRILDQSVLADLEHLMNDIFTRKADSAVTIQSSAFKIPSRVTMSDTKRQTWFAELADPEVPLSKLGKSVPHGAKGHDLLDLLHTNNVAIPRAVWFLRVFGANETAGLRNKPSYNPTQYSVDWAIVVTSYIKKQLADIALPSAPRPGMNIKQTFKGVLSDAESRDRWVSRFTYCLKLLRPFYDEGLVDHRTFLTWIVVQMAACNLAQAGFVAHLADEYLDGVLEKRPLAKPLLDACIAKLNEVRTTSAQGHLNKLEEILKSLIQRICVALPDTFVSPRTWLAHSLLLCSALAGPADSGPSDCRRRDFQQLISDNLRDIQRRNDAMLFRNLPPRKLERLGSLVVDIQILNSICSSTDMSTISFFSSQIPDSSSSFVDKLDTLLTWAVTSLQYGSHRPYAAVTLLQAYHERNARRELSSATLHDYLFDWLDSKPVVREAGNLRAVAGLFGKLMKSGLFDYAAYVQRLVARGEEGLSLSEPDGTASFHRNLLRWIPLHNTTASLSNQRKVIVYGARARQTPEDVCEREMRREIRAILPLVFGGDTLPPPVSMTSLQTSCPTVLGAPCFEQVRTIKQWLLPNLHKFTSRSQSLDEISTLKTYSTAVELLSYTHSYGSLLELSLSVLSQTTHAELLTAVGEVFHRFATIWTAMNVTGTITSTLYSTYLLWRTQGGKTRSLLTLIIEMDNGRQLDATAKTQVDNDIAAFTHALAPKTEHPEAVPSVMPEILLLAEDSKPDAPSILANSLWYRYRTSGDWAWKVWDNIVASLRQVPVMSEDHELRHTYALRYGQFLLNVDHHLPGGIDNDVLQWFLGTGKSEVLGLTLETWDVLRVVLLFLCVHGALSTTTLLQGLVYPAWQLGADAGPLYQPHNMETFIQAASELFDALVLQEECSISPIVPQELLDAQRIRTWRQDAFREPHFTLLASNIPNLVLLEHNDVVSDGLRGTARDLRLRTCESRDIRQSCYRNLDAVRKGFEHPIQSGMVAETLYEPLVNALKMILSESNEDTDVNSFLSTGISSVLSPCTLAATAVQLQFGLRQLGRALACESTKQGASASLDKMTSLIFHHSMASEEAYFIAEMARGVDGPVAIKFINNGFKSIVDILNRAPTPSTPESLLARVGRAGEVLRVLSHVSEPLREEGTGLDLDVSTQERLAKIILESFQFANVMFSKTTDSSLRVITEAVIFLARLLQFDLVLFDLVVIHACGPAQDAVAFALLLDTLYFLIDDLFLHSKTSSPDPFKYYPTKLQSPHLHSLPSSHRIRLLTLFPHLRPNAVVQDLAHAHRDSTGLLVYGAPVQNRPWEWIENLDKDDGVIRNNASLSLELFGAKATGDHLMGYVQDEERCVPTRLEGVFEDNITAESVFHRDWRETRLPAHSDVRAGERGIGEGEDELGTLPIFGLQKPGSRRASPASSVRSRGSVSSVRRSPGSLSGNRSAVSTREGTGESIGSGPAAGRKRKASASVDDDDEVEIIEGPASVNLKKAKMKPKPKTK